MGVDAIRNTIHTFNVDEACCDIPDTLQLPIGESKPLYSHERVDYLTSTVDETRWKWCRCVLQDKLAEAGSVAEESLGSMPTVRSFAAEGRESKEYANTLHE